MIFMHPPLYFHDSVQPVIFPDSHHHHHDHESFFFHHGRPQQQGECPARQQHQNNFVTVPFWILRLVMFLLMVFIIKMTFNFLHFLFSVLFSPFGLALLVLYFLPTILLDMNDAFQHWWSAATTNSSSFWGFQQSRNNRELDESLTRWMSTAMALGDQMLELMAQSAKEDMERQQQQQQNTSSPSAGTPPTTNIDDNQEQIQAPQQEQQESHQNNDKNNNSNNITTNNNGTSLVRGSPWAGRNTGTTFYTSPPTQVQETKDQMTISMDVPGFSPEDLKIQFDDNKNILSIAGKRRNRLGLTYWFSKDIHISSDKFMTDTLDASLLDGVLTITIYKKEIPRPRNISITTTTKNDNDNHNSNEPETTADCNNNNKK